MKNEPLFESGARPANRETGLLSHAEARRKGGGAHPVATEWRLSGVVRGGRVSSRAAWERRDKTLLWSHAEAQGHRA